MKPQVRDALLRLEREHLLPYSIVSLNPPIFFVMLDLGQPESFFPTYQLLFASLEGRKSYCLCAYTWSLTPKVFDSVRRVEDRSGREFPDLQLIHLCNEPGQVDLFAARGAWAVFCNHNCFLDDSIFKPLPSVEKRFDAVYDARLVEWKRHALAREVERLALIYFPIPGEDEDYVRKVRREFSHAHFFNHVEPGFHRYLSPQEVNHALNACRVGLCLSAAEGAMYASGQYLLSGLPVVTTPSSGGREVFFEESFVATVPPEPGAVREAVAELVGRGLQPERIRQATLEKMQSHRQTFISLVQDIYDRHGVQRAFADEWKDVFCNKMLKNQNHLLTLAKIQAADAARGG